MQSLKRHTAQHGTATSSAKSASITAAFHPLYICTLPSSFSIHGQHMYWNSRKAEKWGTAQAVEAFVITIIRIWLRWCDGNKFFIFPVEWNRPGCHAAIHNQPRKRRGKIVNLSDFTSSNHSDSGTGGAEAFIKVWKYENENQSKIIALYYRCTIFVELVEKKNTHAWTHHITKYKHHN